MRVTRNPDANYDHVAELARTDKRLTYAARGLYAAMFALPESWRGGVVELAALGKQGKASTTADLRELERYGYVIRRTFKNENQRTEYELHLPATPVAPDEQ